MGVRELFELNGKVALITGGSRGLGLQIAKGLADMGAKVALSARKAHELEAAKAEFKQLGTDAFTVVNDLSKEGQAFQIAKLGNITSMKEPPSFPKGWDPKVIKVWVPDYEQFEKLREPWLEQWNKTYGYRQ